MSEPAQKKVKISETEHKPKKGRYNRFKQRKKAKQNVEYITDEDKHNELFEKFYKGQNIVPEGEWDLFIKTLKEPLPVTFRINPVDAEVAKLVAKQIKEDLIPKLESYEFEGKKVEIQPLPYYPGTELAWKANLPRSGVRKQKELKDFQNFLTEQSDLGNITRQEAVSMIPPLFMDVEPHHKIIDMCAAPGSKTSQLLEMLATTHKDITGLVVANDNDQKRCYMLTHQIQRLATLFPHVIITNHDARNIPEMIIPKTNETVKFDRILCDVMCSGDGTLRKSPDLWKRWKPDNSLGLFVMQNQVALKAVELLKVGGKMVYSTCTLSPIENEAVVANILRESEGAVELVDISHQLNNFKYMKGLHHWKVMGKDGEWIESYDKVKHLQYMKKGMFPPTEEEAKKMHLERCMRILPHHQDTGGFFIAVFQKVKEVPKKNNEEQFTEKIKRAKGKGNIEDEIVKFLEPKLGEHICDYFGIDKSIINQFIVKSDRPDPKIIYFVSKTVKEIIEAQEQNKTWRIVSVGLDAFKSFKCKDPLECKYRITNEALPSLRPYMSEKRIIQLTKKEALLLLDHKYIDLNEDFLSPEAKKKALELDMGSVVLECKREGKTPVLFMGNRTKTSLQRLVPENLVKIFKKQLNY